MVKFIDLFAGTGGVRLAFEQACDELNIRTKCVFSSEIDKKASASYKLNFKDNPLSDITQVDNIPDFDFLLAGFPCQAFSYAGNQKGFQDETRGTLFFDILRILKKNKPKYLFLENVRGLTTHDKGNTFKVIQESLAELGYNIDFTLLNSSEFGVPQNRVRIYIVGVLGGDAKLSLSNSLGSADTNKYIKKKGALTVGDILEQDVDVKYHCSELFQKQLKQVVGDDLSSLNSYRLSDYRGGKTIHSWDLGIKGVCSEDEVEFLNLLIANRRKKIFGSHQDGKSLTKEQILTFYSEEKFDVVTESLIHKGYIKVIDEKYKPVCGNMSFEVFKFLDPNGISITLTASDSNRLGVIQNNIARRLTPRECARLQGYPDSYRLIEDDNAVYKQMGNGVSVPVIKTVISDFFLSSIMINSKCS
ncbi:DNA (cytosine-5-)-methyltransferase [Pseudoalteromonas sp. H105]|uniref:DNA (cytosine-5-)-methyltransferase n=1 Tax=Pseudoalteromonas sp. H105 TaxID=1348393 RepID=UPI000732040C|nr:DNA (cytosine-5-)-methyltransferase [Pseudoalteromonas sp. H105]KTF13710.1 DNA cytosine methyltransferase [Pseudoalteromonas sp. H105]